MNNNKNLDILMEKPLGEMTGREFCSLLQYVLEGNLKVEKQTSSEVQDDFPELTCYGLYKLHYYIGNISLSRLMALAHEGVLDDAVLYATQSGRVKTYDVEKARNLVNSYLVNNYKK